MSVKIMSAVWSITGTLTATQKLVLLALADNCNDAGECYPSILTLCEKTDLSDRGVQKSIAELMRLGYVSRLLRNGRSTLYTITTEPKPAKKIIHTPEPHSPRTTFTPNDVHPTPERCSPPPPNDVHPTPERGSPITIIEPSIESSSNHQFEADAKTAPPKKSKGTRISDDWVLSKKLGEWAQSEKPHWSIDKIRSEADAFKDYWLSVAGSNGVKNDWDATWRNWVRRARDAPVVAGSTANTPYGVNQAVAREERNRLAAEEAGRRIREREELKNAS